MPAHRYRSETLLRPHAVVYWAKSFAVKKYTGIERSTVVIGEDGTVEKIWRRVKPDQRAAQLLDLLS